MSKKNFRKVPPPLERKVQKITGNEIVVACVKKIKREEIDRGDWAHLGFRRDGDQLKVPASILPHPNAGKYSRKNAEGEEVIHYDLPKVSKAFTMEVPNFGDWSNGSHDITHYRMVWQRSFLPPRLVEIGVDLMSDAGTEVGLWVVRVRVNEVLAKDSPDFQKRLLESINLLQENAGASDVFAADAKLADYLKSVFHTVGWELLPPGQREKTVQTIIQNMRNVTDEVRATLLERYDLLEKMKPQVFVHGSGGFDRYFGAKFADNLVVFENLEYGNALYVMFEDWQTLSQLSRTQLLEAFNGKFERIVHGVGWETKLKLLVADKLQNKPKKKPPGDQGRLW